MIAKVWYDQRGVIPVRENNSHEDGGSVPADEE